MKRISEIFENKFNQNLYEQDMPFVLKRDKMHFFSSNLSKASMVGITVPNYVTFTIDHIANSLGVVCGAYVINISDLMYRTPIFDSDHNLEGQSYARSPLTDYYIYMTGVRECTKELEHRIRDYLHGASKGKDMVACLNECKGMLIIKGVENLTKFQFDVAMKAIIDLFPNDIDVSNDNESNVNALSVAKDHIKGLPPVLIITTADIAINNRTRFEPDVCVNDIVIVDKE